MTHATGSYGYFIIDLQTHYVNRAVRQGGDRQVFADLAERCLQVEQDLHSLQIPTAHIFTFQDVRRSCGTAGEVIYYDENALKVYPSQPAPQHCAYARAVHLDAVYNVTNQNVIFKYDHHAYGTASQGCMQRFAETNHVQHPLFAGAFADNCVWKCAQMALSEQYGGFREAEEATVLLDCIAAHNAPRRLDDLVQQNYEIFADLEKRCDGRLHLTTSDQFISSLKTKQRIDRLAA